jgi:hypothetical protein
MKKILLSFFLIICMYSLSWATFDPGPIFASGGSGPLTYTPILNVPDHGSYHWQIGYPGQPIPVSYNSDFGPWIKILEIQEVPFNENGSNLILDEYLVVAGDDALTDWHVAIVDDFGHHLELDLNLTYLEYGVDGLMQRVSPTSMNEHLAFFFGPLDPGMEFMIHTELIHLNNADGFNANNFVNNLGIPIVALGQHPTIPEPSSLLLLGGGLLGLLAFRRKFKK